MGNSVISQANSIIESSPAGITNKLKVDLSGTLKSFQDVIFGMLNELADETSELHIGSSVFSADQKKSAAVQLLVENKLTELENGTTSLMNIYSSITKLYETAGNMVGSGG